MFTVAYYVLYLGRRKINKRNSLVSCILLEQLDGDDVTPGTWCQQLLCQPRAPSTHRMWLCMVLFLRSAFVRPLYVDGPRRLSVGKWRRISRERQWPVRYSARWSFTSVFCARYPSGQRTVVVRVHLLIGSDVNSIHPMPFHARLDSIGRQSVTSSATEVALHRWRHTLGCHAVESLRSHHRLRQLDGEITRAARTFSHERSTTPSHISSLFFDVGSLPFMHTNVETSSSVAASPPARWLGILCLMIERPGRSEQYICVLWYSTHKP